MPKNVTKVLDSIVDLPQDQRELLRMRYVELLTDRQISEELKISAQKITVKFETTFIALGKKVGP